MAETLQILIGKNQLDPYGMKVAKEICQLYKDRCEEFKNETSLNFGVYFTPAENLCFTAMTKFKEKYGEIPNVSDKKFFTNSVHVPVWEEVTPFEKIDVEHTLLEEYDHIFYNEIAGYCKCLEDMGFIAEDSMGKSLLDTIKAHGSLKNNEPKIEYKPNCGQTSVTLMNY